MATPETLPGYVNRGLEALPGTDTQIFDPRIRAMEEKSSSQRISPVSVAMDEYHGKNYRKVSQERSKRRNDLEKNFLKNLKKNLIHLILPFGS